MTISPFHVDSDGADYDDNDHHSSLVKNVAKPKIGGKRQNVGVLHDDLGDYEFVVHYIMDDFNKSWGTVTWEEVVERDPQVVVIINYGNVTAEQKRDFMMSNPAFKNISAVENDRFVTLEYVEATPGPRNIKAVKKLADAFWNR